MRPHPKARGCPRDSGGEARLLGCHQAAVALAQSHATHAEFAPLWTFAGAREDAQEARGHDAADGPRGAAEGAGAEQEAARRRGGAPRHPNRTTVLISPPSSRSAPRASTPSLHARVTCSYPSPSANMQPLFSHSQVNAKQLRHAAAALNFPLDRSDSNGQTGRLGVSTQFGHRRALVVARARQIPQRGRGLGLMRGPPNQAHSFRRVLPFLQSGRAGEKGGARGGVGGGGRQRRRPWRAWQRTPHALERASSTSDRICLLLCSALPRPKLPLASRPDLSAALLCPASVASDLSQELQRPLTRANAVTRPPCGLGRVCRSRVC